jgi:hypothetical protein
MSITVYCTVEEGNKNAKTVNESKHSKKSDPDELIRLAL